MNTNHVEALKLSLSTMMERIDNKEPIVDQLEEIVRLQVEIADTAPAQLSHFLERRSYVKALEYIAQGSISEDPDRPDCDEEEAHP
jgi:hypothetical protein